MTGSFLGYPVLCQVLGANIKQRRLEDLTYFDLIEFTYSYTNKNANTTANTDTNTNAY